MLDAQVPDRGDFQSLGMSGSFAPSIEGLASDRGYFGLVPEATYPWGTFRDADGKTYCFMRRLPFAGLTEPPREAGPRNTLGRRAVLFVQDGNDNFVVEPASMATGYNTDVEVERSDDRVVWQADEIDERRRGLEATYRPDRIEYRENGLIDIAGASLRQGLQWYLPGRDNGLFYTSQTFDCSGTILGKPVTGFLFVEQAYMRPGGVLYAVHDVLVGTESHQLWYSFATEYEDGEIQYGHFIVGHDRLGIGIVSNQRGLIVQSSTVASRATHGTDGWSERVDLDVDGEAWEVIQPASLRILPTSHQPNPQQEGMIRRVGETRRPVRWMAWGETAHGSQRTLRYDQAYRLPPDS
jgi:hypothetical protein